MAIQLSAPAVSPAGSDAVSGLLDELSGVLTRQRSALESGQLDQLAPLNSELEATFGRMEQWAGGVAGFVAGLQALPDEARQAALSQLRHIQLNHRTSGELIRVTTQRIAALQAFHLAGSEGATYAPGLAPVTGSQLSRRA